MKLYGSPFMMKIIRAWTRRKQLPKSGVVDLKRVESILKEESCHHRGSRRRRVVSEEQQQSFQRNLGQLFFRNSSVYVVGVVAS